MVHRSVHTGGGVSEEQMAEENKEGKLKVKEERVRKRDRERETERETERQTDRQTDR